ncbi:NAD(P)-binding protein [Synechococcus sp. UW179A]|uniref:NAD(P)-binding protein n=1 Tax=Synechococcus sp. UW179A TaxID=2575510 RepID=UPI000E0F70F7|nr:NAD(P)-binding protein [Synechococcus sp. UW179A]
MPGRDVDLVVIGAGLSGCALVAALKSKGWCGTIQILEAGRGPGGRSATRRRRDSPLWRLDHGTPTLSFQSEPCGQLRELMTSLEQRGVVRVDRDPVVGLDHLGAVVAPPDHPLLRGPRWRGIPTMATVVETLLSDGGNSVDARFGERIQTLSRVDERWVFPGGLRGRGLILSGTLLAHPRSLAMLGWRDVPLREAVPEGHDSVLDEALAWIANLNASIRWNLMVQFPAMDSDSLPRQIWLTPRAQQQFGVERIVLQRQQQGGLGLVMHGLDDGALITPETQPQLMTVQEQRLLSLLPEILQPWPSLQGLVSNAHSLGVMRWGAAQPLDQGMPNALQWCRRVRVGFCGDWIAGSGFGMAEGALQSGLDLAELIAS